MDLLSRRAHFSAELRHKLAQRGFDDEEIEPTLERLAQEGYVDDRQTAELWLEQQLARKPQGARKLLAGLKRKGVDGDLAYEAVTEAVGDDEEALARHATERWLSRSPRSNGPRSGAQGLAKHLERLGFRTGTAVKMVQENRDALKDRPAHDRAGESRWG